MATRLLILDHYLTGKSSISNGGDGSLHYLVYAEDGITLLQPLTNLGITEEPSGSMVYQAEVPTWWSGEVIWFADAGETKLGADTFDPEPSLGFQGPSQLTVTFTDVNRYAVSNVTFTVGGIGTAVTSNNGAVISLTDGTYVLSAVPKAGVIWPATTVVVSGSTSVTIVGAVPAGPPPPEPPGPGGRRLRLERKAISEANHYYIRGFRLRIDVIEAIAMPAEIFVYHRHPPDPVTGEVVDEWLTVASFPDLAEYPANNPDPEKSLPFLRKSFIEVDVRSTRDYNDIWNIVVNQACVLRAALNRADMLVKAETVVCEDAGGGAPDSESYYSTSAPE